MRTLILLPVLMPMLFAVAGCAVNVPNWDEPQRFMCKSDGDCSGDFFCDQSIGRCAFGAANGSYGLTYCGDGGTCPTIGATRYVCVRADAIGADHICAPSCAPEYSVCAAADGGTGLCAFVEFETVCVRCDCAAGCVIEPGVANYAEVLRCADPSGAGCYAQIGERCGAPIDCCTGFCAADGYCRISTSGACVGDGSPCASPGECCSGYCTSNGTCGPSGGAACFGSGALCSTASQCCSLLCDTNGFCKDNLCRPDGNACLRNDVCCSGYCNGTTCAQPPSSATGGSSGGSTSCLYAGAYCSIGVDCCSNNCVNHTCQ